MPSLTPTQESALFATLRPVLESLNEKDLAALLADGVGVNHRDPNGMTPLGLLVTWPEAALDPTRRQRMVDLLLDAGADPLAHGATGVAWHDRETPWFHLLHEADPALARHLLHRCPELIARSEAMGRPPLCIALLKRQEDLAMAMLDAGADPDQPWPKGVGQRFTVNQEYGLLPTWIAAHNRLPKALDRLLAAGAATTVAARQEGFYTLVVQKGATDLLDVLERHQVPMTLQEQRDVVPDAILHGCSWTLIEGLIGQGADPLATSSRFGSALQAAISSSMFYHYVAPLLALGADPESRGMLNTSILDTVRQRSGEQDRALARRLEQALLEREVARGMADAGTSLAPERSRARL